MIAFFYENVRKLKKNGKSYWSLLYKVNKLLVNLLYPISQVCRRENGTDLGSRLIVSLTSFPDRIGTVWITIATLLNQTQKPYKVLLWLADEQFPHRKLPKSLLKLQKRGLEICFCEDLKPHKKYFETMLAYPEYFVVTADDDVFYPENHIEQLWKGHERYPDAVVCHWSHRIGFDEKGEYKPYDKWEDNAASEPAYKTLAVGCNGILYPPGSIPREAFVKEMITENTLFTDDLWLKCMEIRNGWKTVNCNETILIYFNNIFSGKAGLWKHNTGRKGNNDKVWSKLMELYPDVNDKLLKEKQD